MNDLLIVLGIIIFALIIWNLSISIKISNELKKRNIKANIAYRRGLIFKYLKLYKEITVEETGKAGQLYFWFLISFYSYFTLLIIAIILSALFN